MPDPKPAAVRLDARNHRARILEVARDMPAASGEASPNSIAKAVGVGPGTPYRHLPTRETLIPELYRHDVRRPADSVPALPDEQPPLPALRLWFERLSALIRTGQRLGDALDAATGQAASEATYRPVVEAVALVLSAGGADATIRPGLDPADLLLLVGCLWRTPDTAEGRLREQRPPATVLRGLQP